MSQNTTPSTSQVVQRLTKPEHQQLTLPYILRSKPYETITEEMAHQYTLPIRGSSSKPDGNMSGYAVQHPPEQVEESAPNQDIPSNIAQASPPIIELCQNQKAWDTIIVCSLLSVPFGIPMSYPDIAKAINSRDERKDSPIGADTVSYMFQIALSQTVQKRYHKTCRYKKWEAVRNKPVKTIWDGNGEDVEIKEACTLYLEALRIAQPEWFPEKGFTLLHLLSR